MKKFMLLYYSSEEAVQKMKEGSKEEKQAAMKLWMEWKDRCGDAIVDMGAPLGEGRRFSPAGSIFSLQLGVTGFTVVQAEDAEKVNELIEEHPHFSWEEGCSIEVYEVMGK